MAGTTLKLGYTNPLTDAFGAHPQLGAPLDLNDGVTFTLAAPAGLEMGAPARTIVTAGNIRAQGERATRAVYRHNRRVVARVLLGPMATYADLASNVRALAAWLAAPPAMPIALQYQPAGAAAPVYLDIVGAAHDIPADEGDWLRLQLEPITITFLARPGLRGDRVTLSNLVVNPGFEAPSGPGVAAFADGFANVNAYSAVSGAAPTVTAGVMTIPTGAIAQFGSPAWGALNIWQVRFQWITGLTARFFLHYVDANNSLHCSVTTGAGGLALTHKVGGANNSLASAATALVNGTWYWVQLTQFPTVAGDPPDVQAALYADNAGAMGAQLATIGPIPTSDAVTALAGRPALGAIAAALAVGGAFAGVHTVAIFGPGGWPALANSGTGLTSAAWEQSAANTYPNGPAASFGAARLDYPPAGTAGATWGPYAGGAPGGSYLMPVAAAGNVLGASGWLRTSGLSANASSSLVLNEYDTGGAFLRATTVGAKAGNQASWTQISGSVTTGANCAYAALAMETHDTSAAGASANATVWFDNLHVWNQTTTGAATMPYCELRFPQSPAQLLVSGLLGDLSAPAYLAFGTYLASWPTGSTLAFAVGRRGQFSAAAQLVGASNGFYGTAFAPQATAVLDAGDYGGYYVTATVTSAGWSPRAFSPRPADARGVYHLFTRFLSKQAPANLANVQARVVTQQLSNPWYGNSNGTDQLAAYSGPWSSPLTASNAWTTADAGQANVPAFNTGALTDPAQTYLTPRAQWVDSTAGGAVAQASWQMLLPVDGSLLVGVLNNPANAPFAVTNSWLWGYADGLGVASGNAAGWTYSLESTPLPNPAHAGGGPGTQQTGTINVNAGADPYLTLDPQQQAPSGGAANQLVAYLADGAGAVLPLAAEIQYSPLYLWPR